MDFKYKWIGLLVIVFIIVGIQAEDYKRFEKIYYGSSYHNRSHASKRISYGEYVATDDNSFFLLDVAYNTLGGIEDEANYTVIIDVPQVLWSSENITRYACVSNISTPIKNPILTKERRAYFVNISDTELFKLRNSELKLLATERLSQEKVMIIWYETFFKSYFGREHEIRSDINVTIAIFDVKTCTSAYIKFSADDDVKERDINVVLYKDSFDIFTCDKKLCKSPTSKISYDFSGHQTGDKIYLKNQLNENKLAFFTPILKSSIVDGFYAQLSSVNDEQTLILAYLSRDGKKQQFLTNISVVTKKRSIDYFIKDPVTSDANGKYTVCQLRNGTPKCLRCTGKNMITNSVNNTIHCLQFMEGNMIMNITIGFPQKATYAGVYNSKDGGLYLVTRYCYYYSCDEFRIMKINSGGDLVKSISIPKSDSECSVLMKNVFDLSERISEFCIHSVCQGRVETVFSVFCVPKSKLNL